MFLIDVIFGAIVWLFLVRLLFQWVRAPFKNSIVQSFYLRLAPVLRIFEKFIPRYGNFSIPCAFVLYLISLLWACALTLSLKTTTFLLAVLLLLHASYWLLVLLLVIYALASFIPTDPNSQFLQAVGFIVRPIAAPFKRRIRPMGSIDISLAVVMLTIMVIHELSAAGIIKLLTLLASSNTL
jgi:YggT family protein